MAPLLKRDGRIDSECIDEVDRLHIGRTTTMLADMIKNLSDHSVDSTIVLVGVAESVDALIAEHISIERNLVQIQMPRMSKGEIFEIIDKGMERAAMKIEGDARDRITQLSQGLPHYTHLLASHSAQEAALKHKELVDTDDVRTAIKKALKQARHSVVSAYDKAVTSPRDNLYRQVLLACALARTDSLGYFYAGDIREPMEVIMGKRYEIPAFSQHLNAFCEQERGPILRRTGVKRRYRFRFVNPLMQPYVIMNGLDSELIQENQIRV